MIVYCVVPNVTETGVVGEGGEAAPLVCATVVLQHSDKSVGFELQDESVEAIVGDGVVIDVDNAPEWRTADPGLVWDRVVHSRFRRALTCGRPSAEIMRSLEQLSRNRYILQRNAVFMRHGKQTLPLSPTMFDDWVLPDGRIRCESARLLVRESQSVALWRSSEWGLYARILGETDKAVVASVARVTNLLQSPAQRVATERELPVW